jgi:hypothetical protein
MPEGVEHALMAENAIGDGELVARFGEYVGHGRSFGGWRGSTNKAKGRGKRKREATRLDAS